MGKPELGKIMEHVTALLRGNLICAGKIFSGSRCKYHFHTRMFAHAQVVIRGGGSLELGNKTMLGRNSMLTAQGGKLVIKDCVGINRDVLINAHESIEIGANTVIAPHVCIYDHDHMFDKTCGVDKKTFKTAPVVIGNNVWIGANAVILRGTIIGDNSVVGAGTVLKGKYPANTMIVQERSVKCIPIE